MLHENKINFINDEYTWIDVLDPNAEDVERISKRFGLHPTSIQDCLDPEHLPKFEQIGPITFIILRIYDESSQPEADTIQELSNKIAFFLSDKFMITIHRKDSRLVNEVQKLCETQFNKKSLEEGRIQLLTYFLRHIFTSYDYPLDQALLGLERFERMVFGIDSNLGFKIQEGYFLKRKAHVFKKIIRLSNEVLAHLEVNFTTKHQPMFQDFREMLENYIYQCDEIIESMSSVLNLHISILSQKTNESSHYTNEVMRVLAMVSVLFLPLNFITGFYGMNFDKLPGLASNMGLFIVVIIMLLTSLLVLIWFRTHGWHGLRERNHK